MPHAVALRTLDIRKELNSAKEFKRRSRLAGVPSQGLTGEHMKRPWFWNVRIRLHTPAKQEGSRAAAESTGLYEVHIGCKCA